MTNERDDKIARGGEYALGLMDPREIRLFESDLSTDPELRKIYADWAEGLVAFDDDGEMPPTNVKEEIDLRLFFSGIGPKPSRFGWLTSLPMRLATVAILLGVIGFGSYNYVSAPTYDAQAVAQADGIDFELRLDQSARVVLIADLVESLPADRDHELWVIPEGGSPVSLGVMAEGKSVLVPGTFKLEGALIAVTVEQVGGSPTGQPTTTPIAAVPITAL